MENRNRTSKETKVFCEDLADPLKNYIVNLEKKSFEKSLHKGSFSRRQLNSPEFIGKDGKLLKGRKKA